MKKLFTLVFVLIASLSMSQNKGTFIDNRDNKSYKWIKIGEQTWMGENLKFNDTSFYNYQTVLNGSKSDTSKIKGIYPDGWHIPSMDEWNKLFVTVGRPSAGDRLKEKSGFGALLNGRYNADKKIVENKGSHSYFWTSNERDVSTVWVHFIYDLAPSVGKIDGDKRYGYSLRCIKN